MIKRLTLATLILSTSAALADVPDDKTSRVEEYQKRHVEFQEVPGGYTLKVDSRFIGDDTLANLLGDPELTDSLNQKFAWRRLRQLGLGLPLVPAGAFIFFDNFFGKREAPLWGGRVPSSVIAPFESQTVGSYLMALGGGLLAAWGTSMLWQWGSETLGFSHANLLEVSDAKSAQRRYNAQLREELVLSPKDVISSASATQSTDAATPPPDSSARVDEAKALKVLESQRGQGYQLYRVVGKFKDLTQKRPEEGWRYYYRNPQWPDCFEVLVPDFGDPKVNKTNNTGKGDLKANWKIDSPQAFATIQEELKRRQLTSENASTSLSLDERDVPLWIVDVKDVRIRVNANSGELLDKTEKK